MQVCSTMLRQVRPYTHHQLDSLLLSTYDTDGELRIYRLRIDFERCALNIQHLCILTSCTPSAVFDELTQLSYNPAIKRAEVTLIEIIPAGPDSKSRQSTPPFVFVAFSFLSHDFHGADNINTVQCKWQLSVAKPSLHPSFSDLSSKKGGGPTLANTPVSTPMLITMQLIIYMATGRLLFGEDFFVFDP